MLNKTIDHMILEEKLDRAEVTIFYKHRNGSSDLTKASLVIEDNQIKHACGKPTISEYFYEIGVLLSLEENKTVDWNMLKEIPVDYLESHPECRENPVSAMLAPGKLLWKAERLR